MSLVLNKGFLKSYQVKSLRGFYICLIKDSVHEEIASILLFFI